jgi:hypothetical protein
MDSGVSLTGANHLGNQDNQYANQDIRKGLMQDIAGCPSFAMGT